MAAAQHSEDLPRAGCGIDKTDQSAHELPRKCTTVLLGADSNRSHQEALATNSTAAGGSDGTCSDDSDFVDNVGNTHGAGSHAGSLTEELQERELQELEPQHKASGLSAVAVGWTSCGSESADQDTCGTDEREELKGATKKITEQSSLNYPPIRQRRRADVHVEVEEHDYYANDGDNNAKVLLNGGRVSFVFVCVCVVHHVVSASHCIVAICIYITSNLSTTLCWNCAQPVRHAQGQPYNHRRQGMQRDAFRYPLNTDRWTWAWARWAQSSEAQVRNIPGM